METKAQTKKMIAYGIAILAIIAVFSSVYLLLSDRSLKNNLNSEKLKNEQLLSEKLAVDKEIGQLKQTIQTLTGKNSEIESLLSATMIKLAEKEKEISGLLKQNATVKSLNKQLAELRQIKTDLLKQVDDIEAKSQQLKVENKDLQNSISKLTGENAELARQIEQLRAQNLLKADNYQVEAFRNVKKEKITIRAKRAKMLSVTLDVPKELTSEISFSITTPDGKVINEKDKALSWEIATHDRYLLASLNPMNNELRVTHQVKLTYQPTSRLKGGIYKIGILNKQGENLGNCRVHLK